MDRLDFASGFGAVWDLIRAANAFIEDRAPWALNKAGDTDAVAARDRRLPRDAAHRRDAGVAGDPERVGGAVAPARPARHARRPARARTRRSGACCPAGSKLEKGDPLFPRQGRRVTGRHVGRRALSPAARAGRDAVRRRRCRRAGARGARRGRRVDGVRRHRARDVAAGDRSRGALRRRVRDGRACIRTTRRNSTTTWDGLVALADAERCVAIGERGFDLHYEHSPRAEQEVAFRRHIQLAKRRRTGR